MDCPRVILLTRKRPIVIRTNVRRSFGVAPRRLRTTVAPGAHTLVLYSPDGPANSICSGRRLGKLTRIVTHRREIVIVTSRVCRRVGCVNGRRDVTRFTRVGSHMIVVGKISGTCTVAN